MTFKDGGAYDFHTKFERVRERLVQAVDVAREHGTMLGDGSEQSAGRGGDTLGAVDMDAIHLDELPAYEETGRGAPVPQAVIHPLADARANTTHTATPAVPPESPPHPPPPQNHIFSPPAEPPPGYEEVQRDSITESLERDLRLNSQ